MPLPTLSPTRLAVFLIASALLTKVYQHNKLVYLTYANQQLSQEHAQLMNECMQLYAHLEKTASNEQIMASAIAHDHMVPLSHDAFIPLATALTGTAS
jgi:hypothetical protein